MDETTGDAAPPPFPWDTGNLFRDFLTFYQMEIADKTELPTPRDLTAARKVHILARHEEGLLARENWPILAQKIKNSPLLLGKTKWSGATFDWVLNEANLVKILEGNYDPRETASARYADAERQLNERLDKDEEQST